MTVIDCTSGYWQIPLSERSKSYTAFSTKSGRWQYKVVPMGITNAAPTFQKNMELMLAGMLRKFCIVYIDDIIVYSNSFEEHIKHLESVFGRLKQCNMVIKPEKLSLCKSEVQYLGHIVGNGIVKPTTDNENKIKEKTLPQTMEEVRSFTMCANYYRRFIPKFAHIAKPLTDIMRSNVKGKKTKVQLKPDAIKAFNKLKEAITSSPVLALPDLDKPFEVRTDASDYAIGGVLFQRTETGEERPVCFGSRVLTFTERHYSASEREMLAIMYFIRYWRPYLWGTQFKVYTDHSPLREIKTERDITRRLTRMILKLQEYDFTLFYTPGKENTVADALSRNPLAGYSKKDKKELTKEQLLQLISVVDNPKDAKLDEEIKKQNT